MFRPFTSSAVLILGAGFALAAFAAPKPVTVNPAYVEPARRAASGPAAEAEAVQRDCQVRITDLTDTRRAPEVLGVVTGKAVKSPEDIAAWLRSIVGGLGARGVTVDFDGAAPPMPDGVSAKISLRNAWVTAVATNITANVVLHLSAERRGHAPIEQDFRGALSTVNWISGEGELRRLVDHAFAKALDNMAVSLHGLCES